MTTTAKAANGEYRAPKLKPAAKIKYKIRAAKDVLPVKEVKAKVRARKHNFPFAELDIEEGFSVTASAEMSFKQMYDMARSYATQNGKRLGRKFVCQTIVPGAEAFIWRQK